MDYEDMSTVLLLRTFKITTAIAFQLVLIMQRHLLGWYCYYLLEEDQDVITVERNIVLSTQDTFTVVV